MRDLTALFVSAFSIGFVLIAISWVTILPSIGALYLVGYLN